MNCDAVTLVPDSPKQGNRLLGCSADSGAALIVILNTFLCAYLCLYDKHSQLFLLATYIFV